MQFFRKEINVASNDLYSLRVIVELNKKVACVNKIF